MTMKYYAKVIALNEHIEEEVVLSFGEQIICCFINEFKEQLYVGHTYLVELGLMFLDEEKIEISKNKNFSLQKIDNTFSYEINGYLFENKIIMSNLTFEDDILYNHSYFENEYVKIHTDRITVDFI
ncbi:hypothetical protein ACP179_10360 [Xenorhabdus stockiae]|uniref:hypothetical protein n=1 Tax=Xenorhabdus stockiae TaxID=351614 RepID=UPI003CF9B136